MGLSTIVAAALKRISWGQVADIAVQYGPDIVKKIRERIQGCPAKVPEGKVTVEQLHERVRVLETALVKQEELIELQNRNIELLEGVGRTLQARLNLFMTLTAVSTLLSLLLLFLVLGR
jgi:hypothetical protein